MSGGVGGLRGAIPVTRPDQAGIEETGHRKTFCLRAGEGVRVVLSNPRYHRTILKHETEDIGYVNI